MFEKQITYDQELPLTFALSLLTKQYIGVMFRKLAHVGIEKYYTAMIIIEKAGGKLNQQNLADELLIDKASVVRMVDYLVDKGFVLRQQNPGDRREYFLVLTVEANRAMTEIRQTISQLNELVFASFTEAEKKQFWKAINQINDTLSSLPAEEVLFEYDPKTSKKKQTGDMRRETGDKR
jgi:DNA-binding MarR family transcriptional regulator